MITDLKYDIKARKINNETCLILTLYTKDLSNISFMEFNENEWENKTPVIATREKNPELFLEVGDEYSVLIFSNMYLFGELKMIQESSYLLFSDYAQMLFDSLIYETTVDYTTQIQKIFLKINIDRNTNYVIKINNTQVNITDYLNNGIFIEQKFNKLNSDLFNIVITNNNKNVVTNIFNNNKVLKDESITFRSINIDNSIDNFITNKTKNSVLTYGELDTNFIILINEIIKLKKEVEQLKKLDFRDKKDNNCKVTKHL